ncbi:PAQR family membrane homeostasis protein TrhA [Nocardioides gilvus]|uniref:PAQR family membrane homeostasis protein TrhA n=1 Tax=Nocardioides gilvus TaxID=1735589 RepID=UPI001EF539B6|nr:hemolysin III family protein [Nocardioides gilvus]
MSKFLDHDAALVVMADKMAEIKPRLRGWLHAGSIPLVLVAGVVLILLSPSFDTKIGSGVFIASALLLFGTSATYHLGTWQPAVWALLRRLDHSNIFILIAGTYTAFAMLLLEGSARVWLLTGIWSGALLGVLFRVFWTGAPRWLYTPIYIGLGWFAVFFIPDFIDGAQRMSTPAAIATLSLVVAGGLLYTVGAVVYGLKKPNPHPAWFGFHEVFHTFTVLAFIAHYVGVSLATYALR